MTSEPLLFIHIPKCAGISICHSLGLESIHLCMSEHKSKLGDKYDKFIKLSCIRHPCDRFVSIFHYLKQQTPKHPFWAGDKEGREELERYKTVSECALDVKNLKYFMFRPMLYWLDLGMPDILLRFETLQQDFNKYLKNYAKKPFLHLNTSKHVPWFECLTSEAQEKLFEHYVEDFNIFGYKL